MKDPLLRLVTPADLPHVAKFLVALGGRTFLERLHRGTPYRYYRWKYYENPAGEAVVGMAVTNEYVVSTAAATPVEVQIGERRCRAYVLGDFFTIPSFRRKGLFSRLLDMICAEAARRGAELLYVQPNENSAPLLEKQGFIQPVQMREHWHPILSTTLAAKLPVGTKLTSKLKIDETLRRWFTPMAPSEVRVQKIERIGPEMDELWSRAQQVYRFSTAHDATRLNWRFVSCPVSHWLYSASRGERLVGFAAVAPNQESGLATLSDLLTEAEDEEAIYALLHAAMDDARAAGLQRVYAWALQGDARTAVDDAIRRTFPVMMRAPVRVAVKLLAEGLELPEYDWRLGPGDFDGV